LKVGEFYDVKITGFEGVDLYGELATLNSPTSLNSKHSTLN
jgi:hypothetical protein